MIKTAKITLADLWEDIEKIEKQSKRKIDLTDDELEWAVAAHDKGWPYHEIAEILTQMWKTNGELNNIGKPRAIKTSTIGERIREYRHEKESTASGVNHLSLPGQSDKATGTG